MGKVYWYGGEFMSYEEIEEIYNSGCSGCKHWSERDYDCSKGLCAKSAPGDWCITDADNFCPMWKER